MKENFKLKEMNKNYLRNLIAKESFLIFNISKLVLIILKIILIFLLCKIVYQFSITQKGEIKLDLGIINLILTSILVYITYKYMKITKQQLNELETQRVLSKMPNLRFKIDNIYRRSFGIDVKYHIANIVNNPIIELKGNIYFPYNDTKENLKDRTSVSILRKKILEYEFEELKEVFIESDDIYQIMKEFNDGLLFVRFKFEDIYRNIYYFEAFYSGPKDFERYIFLDESIIPVELQYEKLEYVRFSRRRTVRKYSENEKYIELIYKYKRPTINL